MKNILSTVITLIIAFSSKAQYYYKDIIGVDDINQTIRLYKDNKVKSVTATGFDAEGRRSSEFSENRKFSAPGNLLLISTRNNVVDATSYYRFDKNGLLTSVSDTINAVSTVTTYSYNGPDLTTIKTLSRDKDTVYLDEQHVWIYNNGKPGKMYRVLDGRDTTEIRFSLDERGNVADEQTFRHGNPGEKIYYYYDDNNRLTDIVRFNTKARKLIPDFMFEYTDKNQVRQKLATVNAINVAYLLWTYVYNEQGLKIKEGSFQKKTFEEQKEMLGKIEYSYQFGE
jgi:hypothetical protein